MPILKKPVTPRQKMINLMYVVLMAMLALNVSPDVLKGFSLVEKGLRHSADGAEQENAAVLAAFETKLKANERKTRPWYDKAQTAHKYSEALMNFIQKLKVSVAQKADGKKADVNNLRNREDLEAASQVMLSPRHGQGGKLCNALRLYREAMAGFVSDSAQQQRIMACLDTEVPEDAKNKKWENYMFEQIPAITALTMLSKIQSDIRHTEGEVLRSLLANVDEKDEHFNWSEALVVPRSQVVVRGDDFMARILMAAVDTTQTPEVYVDGRKVSLQGGGQWLHTRADRAGNFNLRGWIDTRDGEGKRLRKFFDQPYTVVEPAGVVSADLTRVLYAGYNNPVTVSVPGVPLAKVSASITGGSLKMVAPGHYVARPVAGSQKCEIAVFADNEGHKRLMGKCIFRVRRLPEPAPYIAFKDGNGRTERFRGGGIQKSSLLNGVTLGAAIDDGILDVPYKVRAFQTVFFDSRGDAVVMVSAGGRFTDRQIEAIRTLPRGKRFYVSGVEAEGPDGQRSLKTPMEVILR